MSRRRKRNKPSPAPKEPAARRSPAQANSGVAGDAMGGGNAAVFVGPAVMALASLGMIWWTWMTWPDVLVDFGREIYIAWRLAEGETLYTDLAYYFGPLSPYLNSLWLRLFGEHILALAIGNLAVWTAILLVLYRLLRAVADRFAASVASTAPATQASASAGLCASRETDMSYGGSSSINLSFRIAAYPARALVRSLDFDSLLVRPFDSSASLLRDFG